MQLELNKRTDLALQAMQALCSCGALLPGTDLAETLGTSHQYLPQIMSPLVHKRWVSSSRGPRGGYQLSVQLDSISVLELIEAMEGVTDTDTCVLSGEICDASDPCALMSLADAWDAC